MGPHARNRWGVVLAFAALAAATQVLWLTFAPITTATAKHYGVSEDAVGWLAEVFPRSPASASSSHSRPGCRDCSSRSASPTALRWDGTVAHPRMAIAAEVGE